jgi:hypothetical protein
MCMEKEALGLGGLIFMFFLKFKILITIQYFNLGFKHCIKLLIWNMLFYVMESDLLYTLHHRKYARDFKLLLTFT